MSTVTLTKGDQLTLKLRPRRLSLSESGDVDEQILAERNSEIRQIESDCQDLSEITNDMLLLVHEQGELIDQALYHLTSTEINVNEARECLEVSEEHEKNIIGNVIDASVVAFSVGLGAFGFFGGVFVGVPTIIVGGVVSGCFVFIRRTIANRQ